MGSFESWAATIGGILDVAKIEGFLANSEKKRRTRDEDTAQWRAVCRKWWQTYEDLPVGVKDLFAFISEDELLPWILTAETEQGKRQRLGHALVKVEGRFFGEFRICLVDEDRSNRKQYRLERTPDEGDNQRFATERLASSSPTDTDDLEDNRSSYDKANSMRPGTTLEDLLNAPPAYSSKESPVQSQCDPDSGPEDPEEISGDYVSDEELERWTREGKW